MQDTPNTRPKYIFGTIASVEDDCVSTRTKCDTQGIYHYCSLGQLGVSKINTCNKHCIWNIITYFAIIQWTFRLEHRFVVSCF